MENDLVTQKLREMSADLYRLTDRVIMESAPARVRFVRSHGTGLAVRVYVAEGDEDLTADKNVYSLYSSHDRWLETQHNYLMCKARLIRIVTENKMP